MNSCPARSRGAGVRRHRLAIFLFGLALDASAVAAAKKATQVDPFPVSAISTGNVGEFAAALDGGRLTVAFVSDGPVETIADKETKPGARKAADKTPPATVANTKRTVWLRAQNKFGSWGESEVVPIDQPGQLQLAIFDGQPILAYQSADGAQLLARDAKGAWARHELATAAEKPRALSLTSHGTSLHALVVHSVDPKGALVRRVPWSPKGLGFVQEQTLPGHDGRLFVATPGERNSDDVVFTFESSAQVMQRDLGEVGTRRANQLGYTRLLDRFLPTSLLSSTADTDVIAAAPLRAGPALLWSRREGKRSRMYLYMRVGNRFVGPNQMLDDDESPVAIAVTASPRHVMIAIVHRSALLLRRQTIGAFWDEWRRPPGATRALGPIPVDLRVFMDDSGIGRIVLKEKVFDSHQLVEWVDPPHTIDR